ncbi:MAG: cytochrome c biogenesis protein CcsA [Acidimicrobiia bacterium]
MRSRPWLDMAAVAALLIAFGAAVSAPPDQVQGDFAKILYVHVPSAWLAYLAFAVTLLASVVWLVRRRDRWDRLAAASAEVGVFFVGLTLVTGMIWGRPTWGTWWEWGDARMTTTALMFLVYLGYLGLRRAEHDFEKRARRSAILGVLAFALVPVVHFSVLWWRTLHQPPTLLRPETLADLDSAPIDPSLRTPLFLGLAAFTLVYAALVRRRMFLARLEDEYEQTTRPLASRAIEPPRLDHVRDV